MRLHINIFCLTLGLSNLAFAGSCSETEMVFHNETGHQIELSEANAYGTKIEAAPVGTVYQPNTDFSYIASSSMGYRGRVMGKLLFLDLEDNKYHVLNYELRSSFFRCYVRKADYFPINDAVDYIKNGSSHVQIDYTLKS